MSNSGGQAPALIASGDSLPAPNALPVDAFAYILDDTSSTWRRFLSARSLGDGDAGAYYPAVASRLKAGGNYDVARTPNVFNAAGTNTAASSPIWTPSAGKKFRLMGYSIQVTGDSATAVAADQQIRLLDSGTPIGIQVFFFTPAAAGTALGLVTTGWVTLGNGILSAVANNVLNVNLANAFTSGRVQVQVVGTEE